METSTISRNKQKIAKLPEQIDVSLIKTSVIMYNNKKKYSLLSYDERNNEKRDNLFIQTPLFESVLDVENYNEYGEYYFKIPNDETGNKFLDLINSIEKRLISLAYENKNNWFENKDNIKFRSSIKNIQNDTEDDNSKVIKIRIPYNIKCKRLFVESLDNMNTTDYESINLKNLDNGYIRIIININAIWFSDDMFGLYIRPVYLEEIKLCEYSFQENDNVIFLDTELCQTNNVDVDELNKMVNANQHFNFQNKNSLSFESTKINNSNKNNLLNVSLYCDNDKTDLTYGKTSRQSPDVSIPTLVGRKTDEQRH